MSSKSADASIKKLVSLGYSKSKSQKALKECGNNFNQAKVWLEKTKEDEERKAHEAELAVKAKAHADKVKKEQKERRDREALEGPDDDIVNMKRHPCISQYGSCRYGASCMFKKLPYDTCINHVVGNCLYGDHCRNRHAIRGVDIRKIMNPDRDDEHEYIRTEDGNYVQVKRHGGKVQDGELWMEEFQAAPQAAPLPEPSAFATDDASVPTYSEPLPEHLQPHMQQHHGGGGGAFQPQQHAQQQVEVDVWGNPVGPAGISPGGFVPSNGDASSGVVGYTLTHNARTPTSPQAPTPFLAKARIGQHVPQPIPQPMQRVSPQPAAAAGGGNGGPSTATASSVRPHPCVVQMGECRFGSKCNYADVRGDVCVHFLNSRCKYSPADCRYLHEYVTVGGQPSATLMAQRRGQQGLPPATATVVVGAGTGTGGATPPQHGASPGSIFDSGGAADSIWGNPAPFGSGASLGPPSSSAAGMTAEAPRPGGPDDAWAKAFDAPTRDESARMAGDAMVARMAADMSAAEAVGTGSGATGGWRTAAGGSAPASPGGAPTTPPVMPHHHVPSKAPPMESEEEVCAFAALIEVFPHVDGQTILHALRRCGNDRKLVAQVIATDAQPENIERQLATMEDHTEAINKSVALATLCQLIPAMEPASLQTILDDCRGDFDAAIRTAQCTTENIVASDGKNQWATGTTRDAGTGRATGFSPADTMKLDRLAGMYRDMDRQIIERAFEAAERNTTDAVAILNHINSDMKLIAHETREQWGRQATTAHIGSAAKDKQSAEKRAAAAAATAPAKRSAKKAAQDDFGFTVTSGDTDGAADAAGGDGSGPRISDRELYKQTKEEASDHSDWRRTRQEAYLTNSARQQMVALAINAYSRQQHSVGRNLLRKAAELKRRYERLNMLAMHALERERGAAGAASAHNGVCVLDLHGFHVDEAMDVLARRVDECVANRVTKLRVVVGHGNHSRSGRSVIYPRVHAQLKAHPRCIVKSVLPAEIVVNIELTH